MALFNKVSDLASFRSQSRDWTQQELAEFYRVENALVQAGMRVVTERGLSDEGEPWFIFCRAVDNEPVVHFARIDGQYVIDSEAFDAPVRGHDFQAMIHSLLRRHRLNTHKPSGNSNVFIHPAALLIAVVGVAFFKTQSQAQASEDKNDASTPTKVSLPALNQSAASSGVSIQTSGVSTNTQISDSQAWAEQALRIAIATIASLTEAEIAAAKQTIDNANQIAAALETGVAPAHKSTETEAAANLYETTGFLAPNTSAFSGDALPAETQKQDIKPVDAALLSSALSLIDVLAKVPAAPVVDKPALSLEINHQFGFQVAQNAPMPSLIASLSVVTHTASDDTAHIFLPMPSQQGVLQPLINSNEKVVASRPIISVSLVSPPVIFESQSLAGSIGYVINLKSFDTSSSASFLSQNYIEIMSADGPISTVVSSLAPSSQSIQTQPTVISTTDVASASVQGPPTITAAAPTQDHQSLAPIVMSLTSLESVQGSNFAASLIQFINEVPGVQVSVTTSNNYAFFNPTDFVSPNTPLGELMLTFMDGSSISIIGQQAEINAISANLI